MGKMGDDIFECFRAGIKEAADSNTYAHDTISALFNEADRARRVEDEQAEQLRQKDERIAKLAALMGVPDGGRYLNDWESRAEVVRQKHETIRALAAALDEMTFTAAGLHDLYRLYAQKESDGSHESAFKAALALAQKSRTP
jgi:hypothetical protein